MYERGSFLEVSLVFHEVLEVDEHLKSLKFNIILNEVSEPQDFAVDREDLEVSLQISSLGPLAHDS